MSTNYSTNAVKIIDSALRALGVLRSGDTSNNDPVLQADCLESLNLMIKNWQNYGIEQWSRETYTFSNLVAYQSSYRLTDATFANVIPDRIIQAYVTPQANIDVDVSVIGMSEYWQLANKQATGQPNQVAYNFQASYGDMYVWPVPTTNNYTFTIVYHKPYDDFDSVTDVPDLPQRWFEPLKWNLAVRLAPEFGKQVSPEIAALAKETLNQAIDEGYEDGGFTLSPDTTRWR